MYIDGIHKRRVASVGNKGKWPLFKASCLYARQVAVIYRGGTSVVRNLKFLTPFFSLQQSSFLTITVTYSSSRYWWVTLCNQHSGYRIYIFEKSIRHYIINHKGWGRKEVIYLRIADISCTQGVRESIGLSYRGPYGGVLWHYPPFYRGGALVIL